MEGLMLPCASGRSSRQCHTKRLRDTVKEYCNLGISITLSLNSICTCIGSAYFPSLQGLVLQWLPRSTSPHYEHDHCGDVHVGCSNTCHGISPNHVNFFSPTCLSHLQHLFPSCNFHMLHSQYLRLVVWCMLRILNALEGVDGWVFFLKNDMFPSSSSSSSSSSFSVSPLPTTFARTTLHHSTHLLSLYPPHPHFSIRLRNMRINSFTGSIPNTIGVLSRLQKMWGGIHRMLGDSSFMYHCWWSYP